MRNLQLYGSAWKKYGGGGRSCPGQNPFPLECRPIFEYFIK